MSRTMTDSPADFAAILTAFREGQRRSRRAIHAAMLETYLEIGAILSRLVREEGWTAADIRNLSQDLVRSAGAGRTFTASNLECMLRFHEAWARKPDLLPLLPELSWSCHQVLLNECTSGERRERLLAAAAIGKWTRQELEEAVRGEEH